MSNETVSLEVAIEMVLRDGPTFETIAGLCKMASLAKREQSCPTCEALARTVMLDQTSHDTQRKPLPCEVLRELWCDAVLANNGSGWFVVSEAFARAIEAAHGIRGEA